MNKKTLKWLITVLAMILVSTLIQLIAKKTIQPTIDISYINLFIIILIYTISYFKKEQ